MRFQEAGRSLGSDYHLLEGLHVGLVGGIGERVEDLLTGLGLEVTEVLEAFPADAPSELHVFLHDGDSVGVNRAEIGILEESGQVTLSSFLKGEKGVGLEAQLTIDAVADGSHEPLEGGLGEKELSGLLILLDLTESDSTGSESELLLHATLGRRSLLDDGLGLASSGGDSLATLGIGSDVLLAFGSLGELGFLSSDFLSSNLYSGHCVSLAK
jgi:hypothetical protein